MDQKHIYTKEEEEEENQQFEKGLKKKNQELHALYEVGRKLSETLNLKDVYWVIFEEIGRKLLGSPHLNIALLDEKTETIRCDFAIVDGEEVDPLLFPPMALGEGPTSETIRTRLPRIIDLEEARRQLQPQGRFVQVGDDRHPLSALYVPLIGGDKVLGVLSVQHYEKNAFVVTDLNLLSTLANQASIAIQNAQYVGRIRKDAEELNARLNEIKHADQTLRRREAVSEAISFAAQQFLQVIAWRKNIQEVLRQLGEAAEVSRVYIFENERGGEKELVTQKFEWVAPGVSAQLENSALQHLSYEEAGLADWKSKLVAGEMVVGNVREFSAEIQALMKPKHILSLVVVPIFAGEDWWGFVGFDDCWNEREWEPSELEALKTAASILGAAIQREWIETAIQRRNDELAGLYEITEAFNVLTEPRETYQTLTARLAKLLNAEYCLVALLNETAGEIQAQVPAYGIEDAWVSTFHFSLELGREVWDPQKSIFVANQRAGIPESFQHFARALNIESIIAVPMIIRDNFAGVIFAANKPGGFQQEDIHLLQVFTSQIALVIDKMRLFETTQRQLVKQYALYTAANASVAATDEDSLISTITDILADLLYSDNFGVLLLDKSARVLRVHASYRGVSEEDKRRVMPLDGTSITAWVASTGSPYLSQDVAKDEHYLEIVSEVRSELCVPIKVGETVLGVINTESCRENAFRDADQILLTTLAGLLSTALERIRAEKLEREQRALAEALRDAATALNSNLDFDSIQENILDIVGQVVPHITATIMLIENQTARVIRHRGFERFGDTAWLGEYRLDIREAKNIQEIIQTRRPVVLSNPQDDPRWIPREGVQWIRSYIGAPILRDGKVVGILNLDHDIPGFYHEFHAESLNAFANQVAIAMENSRLFEAEKQRTAELEILLRVSSELRAAALEGALFPQILKRIASLSDARGVFIGLYDLSRGDIFIELGHGIWRNLTGTRLTVEECACGENLYASQPLIINDIERIQRFPKADPTPEVQSLAYIPLNTQNFNLGILGLGLHTPLREDKVRILMGVADIAAGSIHRASLLEQTTQRLQRIEALRTIDNAINSSLDLPFTLSLLLDQVISQLRVDAAHILLYNYAFQTLEHAASKGFFTLTIKNANIRLGQGPAGRAVRNRKSVFIPHVREETESHERAKMILEERFISYCSHPLIAKGQVVGLLEIFHRSLLAPDDEWFDFLEALAGQAAIAINNAQLFKDLQEKNQELVRMYDSTLEGWVYALDLRDKETEGHSRRVVELTLQLAQMLGVSDEELIHIRRGALLHDIGKIGVSDSILHKPGQLTEEEWGMMRKHPEYAYKMLYPISYLRPSLEIPYCHHEKWDGTGYPRGLKGEEIPFAARIFAVVDVWDALRSDRPYRKAWSHKEVLAHISKEAGTHFDPKIVKKFIELMEEEEEELSSWHPS